MGVNSAEQGSKIVHISSQEGGISVPVLWTPGVQQANETVAKETFVLFILPPGSSPISSVGGKDEATENNRVTTADYFAQHGISSGIYLNPGKSGSYLGEELRQETGYSFRQTVQELQEVLRFVMQEGYRIEDVVLSTSSLGIIPTTRLLMDNKEFFKGAGGYPRVMVGSAISSLDHLVRVEVARMLQGKITRFITPGIASLLPYKWLAPLVANHYAERSGLVLDDEFQKELCEHKWNKVGFRNLYLFLVNREREVPSYFYGMQRDGYRNDSDTRVLEMSETGQGAKWIDAHLFVNRKGDTGVGHELSVEQQEEARELTLQFLQGELVKSALEEEGE